MRRHRCLFVIAQLLATLAAPAHAGRPLQTEDAGLIERGSCELEGFGSRMRDSFGSDRATSLQWGCGVAASTQLALALTRLRALDDARGDGAVLSGKTRLWQGSADADAPALTIAYLLSALKPAAQSWHGSSSELRLAHSRPLPAGLTLHANAGHARNGRTGIASTTWGVAVEAAAFGAVAPMAELFGNDREPAWGNLGLRAGPFGGRLFIDASYGRQLSSMQPHWVTLGFKVVF